ncbi:MAG: HAMP domain-containing sensor histidine kinase [Candidatus Omnitrophota bacterium]
MLSDLFSTAHHKSGGLLIVVRECLAIVLGGTTGSVNERQKHFLKMAEKTVEKLTKLINEVFDLQQLAEGRMEFYMKSNDINDVVKEVKKKTVSTAERSDVHFVDNLNYDLPKTLFDRDKIKWIISNLITDAFEATEKGSVTVTTKKVKNQIQVTVQDTGKGLKQATVTHLLNDSESLEDEEKGEMDEIGLDLTISERIIEKHKGKFWAETELGKGSAFHFTLPVKSK